jgi:hypothetical protein
MISAAIAIFLKKLLYIFDFFFYNKGKYVYLNFKILKNIFKHQLKKMFFQIEREMRWVYAERLLYSILWNVIAAAEDGNAGK